MTLDTVNNPNITAVAAVVLDAYDAAPSTVPFNQNNFWYYETVYSKYLIEQNLQAYAPGWTCTTFIVPHNDTSADLRAYLADDTNFSPLGISAYTGARGAIADEQSNTGEGVDLYDVYGPNPYSDLIGADEIERDSAALGEWMSWIGGVCALYGHNSETSLADWHEIIATIKAVPGCSFYSFPNLITTLRAQGTVVDRTCTITWPDNVNFSLQNSSPCINTGDFRTAIDIDGTRGADPDGDYVYRLPNQGIYQKPGTPTRGKSINFGGPCFGFGN
jgi:hypothetical protein